MSALPPDSRTLALARLQASRERLLSEMRPGPNGRPLHWLEHPWRMLRRWWRRTRPAVRAGEWLQTSSTDPAALQKAGEAALVGGSRWVKRHPLAGMALAATLGALLIHKRAALWGLLLGVGRGLVQQGQLWALRRASDPALYAALVAALMAWQTAPDKKEE